MSQTQKEIAQAKTEKRFIIPQPSWQSTENMDLQGDVLEALEHTISNTFDKIQELAADFQKVTGVLQQIIGRNVKSGKVTLDYVWNNGEKATKEEAEKWQADFKLLQERRLAEAADAEKNRIAQANAEKTGLVSPDGSPIGSDTPLEDSSPADEAAGALAD